MSLAYVFGLNYQSASFEIREKLAFSREEIPFILHKLQDSGVTSEILVLSTCNRTEIYCVTQDINFVINTVCDIKNVCPRTVKNYSYVYNGIDCAKHLFRVASGLESMVLGETEIVAQVKEAVNIAKEHNSVHSYLSGLFQMSFAAAKIVRSKTAINNISISIGNAAVDLIQRNTKNLPLESILFVGAGKMMQQIVPYFKEIQVNKKTIINRTLNNAKTLAQTINASYLGLSNLADVINDYSIIIVCCNSNTSFLNNEIFKNVLKEKELLIIDLSMPLITNINLLEFPNIKLFSIDDIAGIVDVGIEKRKLASIDANIIINEQIEEYQNWLKKRGLSPLIKALRNHAENIRLEVLSIAQNQLQNGESADEVIKQLSIKLTNKLLHEPTVNLCISQKTDVTTNLKLEFESNKVHQDELVSLVKHLYNLNLG